jgi:MFS family permease
MDQPMALSAKHERLAVIASSVGSVLEMYDFVIYAFLATVLAQLFFPNSDSFVAHVKTFAIFAVGYFSRPLGGIIFGWLCDKRGRRFGLIYSIVLMGVPIFLIGCLPTYQTWGHYAALSLLVLRLLQGLSVGGEFPAGSVFLAEHAAPHRRALVVSLMFLGVNFGIVLGSLVGSITTNMVSEHTLLAYAWRIPFLLGGVLAFVGYIIRRKLQETSVFLQITAEKEISRAPLIDLFRVNFRALLKSSGLVCVMAAAVSTLFLFMPTYLSHYLHIPLSKALLMNTVSLFVFSCFIPLAGSMADKIGTRAVYMMGVLALLFLLYPLYKIMGTQHDLWLTLWAMVMLGFTVAFIIGPIGVMLATSFRASVRTSGFAVAYNVSFGVIGGLAPLVLTVLLHHTGNLQAPTLYLGAAAIISFLCVLFFNAKNTV